ncbi:MAG: SIR2 family NAD-dependent protein deacylase [Candidatus Freyarchaeota archaeon]
MHRDTNSKIHEVVKLLKQSSKCVVLTGAGVSVESGIPDFRGPEGTWKKFDSEIATASSFVLKPHQFWLFAMQFAGPLLRAEPNPAHKALAELEKMGHVTCIITQNIDGLHQKAGSKNVIELHGTAWRAVCVNCGRKYPFNYIMDQMVPMCALVPRCMWCGHILKPDATLFFEEIPQELYQRCLDKLEHCDLLLAIGSTLLVEPSGSFPEMVKNRGGKVVIINLEKTWFDDEADVVINGKASEILKQILREVKG